MEARLPPQLFLMLWNSAVKRFSSKNICVDTTKDLTTLKNMNINRLFFLWNLQESGNIQELSLEYINTPHTNEVTEPEVDETTGTENKNEGTKEPVKPVNKTGASSPEEMKPVLRATSSGESQRESEARQCELISPRGKPHRVRFDLGGIEKEKRKRKATTSRNVPDIIVNSKERETKREFDRDNETEDEPGAVTVI